MQCTGRVPGSAPEPSAAFARFVARDLDFLGTAEGRVLEIDLQLVQQIFAALGARAAPARAGAEELSEKVAEDVGKVVGVEAAHAGVRKALVAVLVVQLTLLGVA